MQPKQARPKLELLGIEGGSKINVSYCDRRYQVTVPFDEIDAKRQVEREVPSTMYWGDSVQDEIERMEARGAVTGECDVFLSCSEVQPGRKSKDNPEGLLEMRIAAPFSRDFPLGLTQTILIGPEDQNNPAYRVRFSFRWRCEIRAVR